MVLPGGSTIPRAKILIVDDEERLRLSLAEALELEGYTVATAADALEALEVIKTLPFDLLLTDLVMPSMDGLTFLEKARQLLPEAVFIFMTGYATVESAVRALKGGAYDYLLKPFKLEELFHVVAKGLEVRRLKQENLHLLEINRRLQEIDRIKSDLLSAVTHEFRTPLTVIYGWLDLLLDGQFGHLTPQQQESLASIRQSAVRLGRLISNLLAYVELERGEPDLRIQDLHLGELLKAIVRQLEREVQEKEIRVTWNLSPVICRIRGDPEKIQLLFFNLVENAVKFNEHGGEVLIEVKETPSVVEVSLVNSRGKIPRHQLSRLFQPFTQGDMSATRPEGGLGLGLAVSRAIVEAHHGSLEIGSGEGEGTTVRVRFPVPERGKGANGREGHSVRS